MPHPVTMRHTAGARAIAIALSSISLGATGTAQAKFPSLEAARDHARAQKASGLPPGGLTLLVEGGKHFRTSAFRLSEADSGEPGKPIVYRGSPVSPVRVPVRVIGGQELPAASFAPVTSASPAWVRLDPLARGQVLSCDLFAEGITSYGTLSSTSHGLEVSFDGELMPLARWPDEGAPLPTVATALGGTSFTYTGTRPERWTDAPDPWAWGLWFHGWRDNHEPIAAIDAAAKTITLGSSPQYGIRAGQPWYAENLLEELDSPGEWYVDRVAGLLYFWPPSDIGQAEVIVSTLDESLVELTGASHVVLEGMSFELGWSTAIVIQGGSNNVVRGCEIKNTGTWGVSVSGSSNGIRDCHVHHTGGRAVDLDGGDRTGLVPGRLFVENCHIHHFGEWQRTYAPAVRVLGGVPAGGSANLRGHGCVVSHNLIHDAPHNAVMYGGNDNTIEFNEVHDVCSFTDDAGAFYTGRDWGSHGNVVRYNFIHHVSSPLPNARVHGIYVDDCDSGDRIHGNVLYEITGNAVMIGGGRDNLVENNVIARCGAALFTDRRGNVQINNSPGSSWNLLQRIERFDYTNPPWSTAYPSLAAIMANGIEAANEPEGNVVERNLGWMNGTWLLESSWGGAGGFGYFAFADNIEDEDPLFADEQALDLTLLPGSPAYTIPGFEPIPFRRIGLLDRVARRAAPVAPGR